MDEQREYPRASLHHQLKYYKWDRPSVAEVHEISANGLFVRTKDELDVGSMLTVRLSLPGYAQAWTVLCKVVRSVRGGFFRPGGVGLRFLDLTPSAKGIIQSYVTGAGGT